VWQQIEFKDADIEYEIVNTDTNKSLQQLSLNSVNIRDMESFKEWYFRQQMDVGCIQNSHGVTGKTSHVMMQHQVQESSPKGIM